MSYLSNYELRYRHIVVVVLAIYAVWTPFYFLFPSEFDRPPRGRIVEQLTGLHQTPDGRYEARTYKFAPKTEFSSGRREWIFSEDEAPIVYEGPTPLPPSHYELQELSPKNVWRFVTFKTSDGSDPRRNGRHYYLVQP